MDEFRNWLEQKIKVDIISKTENGDNERIHDIKLILEALEKDEPALHKNE
jgi:hypothetical protein